MSWVLGVAVYLIIWWLVLFMVLPFGVVTQEEADGVIEPGTPSSAPARSKILVKMLITTVISAVLWAGYYLIDKYELISIR